MMPRYNPAFDWETNIADLASKLASLLRERAKTRETLAPFPNTDIPSLIQANINAVDVFDAETRLLEQQHAAAAEGSFWWDPRATRLPGVTLNPTLMEWWKQANQRGKLVHPDELVVSRHSSSDKDPMLVRRS